MRFALNRVVAGIFGAACAAGLVMAGEVIAEPVDIRGYLEKPSEVHGTETHYRLAGDARFGWRTGQVAGDLEIAGHQFIMDTGGGNTIRLAGAISGDGTIRWQGGGPGLSQRRPSYLEGERPNTFSGTFILEQGLLVLAKPPRRHAIAGPLVLGGENRAGLRWAASHQIADDAPVTFTGGHTATLEPAGHHETLGTLALLGDGEIVLEHGTSSLRFADSSAIDWQPDKQLIVQGRQRPNAGPGDRVSFGTDGDGLSPRQLAQIGFRNPAGHRPGLYRARIRETGELVPGDPVDPVDPTYDLSQEAADRRRAIYETDGPERLAGLARGLQRQVTIAFFGDSITWQGGYLGLLGEAVAADPEPAGTIRLLNRGINGGGCKHLRDGAGGLFDQDQPPLAELLARDQPDIVVLFIGVNDANWLNTEPDEFRKTMAELIQAVRDRGSIPIVATPMLAGELPDGGNPLDQRLDTFARITREVAEQAAIAVVDLRGIAIAHLKDHNYEIRLDGTIRHRTAGVLTHDGVHPVQRGNRLIAGHLAAAIVEALEQRPE